MQRYGDAFLREIAAYEEEETAKKNDISAGRLRGAQALICRAHLAVLAAVPASNLWGGANCLFTVGRVMKDGGVLCRGYLRARKRCCT